MSFRPEGEILPPIPRSNLSTQGFGLELGCSSFHGATSLFPFLFPVPPSHQWCARNKQVCQYYIFSKPVQDFIFVFVNPAFQIVRNADIHYLVVPIGQQIDLVASFRGHKISPFGRNDIIGLTYLPQTLPDAGQRLYDSIAAGMWSLTSGGGIRNTA
jgi:hypothetical protein